MKKKTDKIEYKKALIYCRVSSKRQSAEGHGLDSQEHRCREYAARQGYAVEKVFPDDVSGGGDFMNRPGMASLLAYLDARPHENYVIVFDDLKRFARDTIFHLKLREAFRARFAKLECLNFNFDDSPEGEFVETIFAAQGKLEKEQNKRQVIQKMKARLERGYWPFFPPPGLKYFKHPVHGKLLTPDESVAGILKDAIEKYSNFELSTHEDVRTFILAKYRDAGIKLRLSLHGVKEMLTEVLYAGKIQFEKWGVPLRSGHHQGIISWDTFVKVQERLNMVSKPRLRKDYSEDFPLRNFVLCEYCKKPMTAAWYKGKLKKFPYYLCKNVSCPNRRKSISRDKMQEKFVQLVHGLKTKPKAEELVLKILDDIWDKRKQFEQDGKAGLARQAEAIELKISSFANMAAGTQNSVLVRQYEKEIEKLAAQREDLQQQIQKQSYSESNFKMIAKEVVKHLEEPENQWENGVFYARRRLLNIYFSRGVVYSPLTGFQTPDLPLIVKVLSQKHASKNSLVEMPGVKPGSRNFLSSHCSQD